MSAPSAAGCAAVGAGVLVLAVTCSAVTGWALMVLLGILHSFFPSIPPAGFWPCWGVMFLLSVVASALRGGRAS